ncbi:hypothetical protein O6H91_17G000200 [Diphasiastrum complanatum]|uniref:Uncharacterized protein n=1 Tax=Diphasiastrum complanatum TaxID=34168 RepID=A0ACC2B3G4_DIPCM|nr:hypothetical protein O6H91_17G000200 [Diphasiastrum complanatum]
MGALDDSSGSNSEVKKTVQAKVYYDRKTEQARIHKLEQIIFSGKRSSNAAALASGRPQKPLGESSTTPINVVEEEGLVPLATGVDVQWESRRVPNTCENTGLNCLTKELKEALEIALVDMKREIVRMQLDLETALKDLNSNKQQIKQLAQVR